MPIALAAVGIGMSVAGGISNAMAAKDAAERQAAYYEYLAKNNDYTTEMYEKYLPAQIKNIKNTAAHNVSRIQEGAADVSKVISKKGKEVVGSQSAAAAANGVVGGTVEDISTDTANKISGDLFNVRYEADLKSWDTITLADQQEREANLQGAMKIMDLHTQSRNYRLQGKYAIEAGNSNMWGGMLSTAGSTMQNVYSIGRSNWGW